MPNQVKNLTSDQLRRIYRDFLTGRPKEKLMKKYDISEDVFWEIVGMYAKKKHPNDVGNAQDIEGPADLLVTSLDTGSTATEHPIVARNPDDLNVVHERVIKEYDYDGPEERARVAAGEASAEIAKRNADEAKTKSDQAKKVIAENKEATDATLKELTETSKAQKAEVISKAVERAKAAPSAEEVLRLRNEAREANQRAEVAAEALRNKTAEEHAAEMSEKWPEMVKAGKEQNAEAQKKQDEARTAADEKLADDYQEAERAQQESAERVRKASGAPDRRGDGSTQRAEGDTKAQEDKGDQAGNKASDSSGRGDTGTGQEARGTATSGAVSPANTSPNDQANPVEPAKVEPDGLKPK